MPVALLLLIAAGLGWAWWTGRLKGLAFEDGIAGAAFLLGMRFATTGKPALGLPLVAGATLWAFYRRKRARPLSMPLAEARQLLGVDESASLADIRDAHRRLIAKVHPDTGGSAELAHRVNVARDTLVEEMNRRTPRAS
ncbi:J domain-containing protein [Allosphingosinicella sp.]|uniref:J domain-containing protein n=1 Tax=Allosphingosinicella sp. TaxID=2823234 RepID=UPI002FC1341C